MIEPFYPQLVYFEPRALEYPLGKELYEKFKNADPPVEIRMTTSHNQIRDLPGENDQQKYRMAKSTLVVGIRKTLKFDSSKPSAEYALPLATGCMGHCHYCYLQTTLGSKPYIRVYVNLDEIFEQMDKYMEEREGEITRFEASCTSDIVGIDHLVHVLKPTIEHIGKSEWGRLRFVTKFPHVDHLLDAKHNNKTRFRFSINAPYVIKNFEMKTASLEDRLIGARKVAEAKFPLGFIVAPIYLHEGWEQGYEEMFKQTAKALEGVQFDVPLTFELIQHRFTKPAKRVIEERYPNTKLEMDEEKRKYKWGKYGIGKYVYETDEANEIIEKMNNWIKTYFPEAIVEYFT